MRRWIDMGNGLLLVVAWLLLLTELRTNLLTGLAPVLVVGLGTIEALGLLAVFRVSVAGNAAWRRLLPAVVAAACVLYSCWPLAQCRQLYQWQ